MKYDRSTLLEVIRTAEVMIGGSVAPIEGSRAIARLRTALREENDELSGPFVEIDMESSDLEIADSPLWSQEFRGEIRRRFEGYEDSLRPLIVEPCRAIIVALVARLKECPVCGFLLPAPRTTQPGSRPMKRAPAAATNSG